MINQVSILIAQTRRPRGPDPSMSPKSVLIVPALCRSSKLLQRDRYDGVHDLWWHIRWTEQLAWAEVLV